MTRTSDQRAYVWNYLPGETRPIVAGVVAPSKWSVGLTFQYGTSYLNHPAAIGLGPDLPLQEGVFPPVPLHRMPSTLRDAMPDSWGRAVINRELGADSEDKLPDIRYMLESGSDRVGSIDFQESATEYVPRLGGGTLVEASNGAFTIDSEGASCPLLGRAVRNTLTSVGGSQPKAYVRTDGREWLAKFTTVYDRTSPLIKAEAAADYLARLVGIDVPDAKVVNVEGRGVAVLQERFDRVSGTRRQVISGHTISDFHGASGGSYPDLLRKLRVFSNSPDEVGPELFTRLAFRTAMRIDDDHLRNIAFFWDGENAAFTPAFDLSPDLVAKPTALTHVGDEPTEFSVKALIDNRRLYGVERARAEEIAQHVLDTIISGRAEAADFAMMSGWEKDLLNTRTATKALIGDVGVRVPFSTKQSTPSASSNANQERGKTTARSTPGSFAPRRNTPPEGTLS